jgi:8-oxo-dGTP pyrophosphatase MutT (NUDIX family)
LTHNQTLIRLPDKFIEGLPRGTGIAVNMLLRAVAARETDSADADIKPRRQVAALPYVRQKDGLRVLLVTSRETGRLVLPKGWPEKGMKDAAAAELEAFEEAGVKGSVARAPIGSYTYTKIIGPGFALACTVDVYPLAVRKHLRDWPEKSQRERLWLSRGEAALRVAEPALAEILRRFKPD